MIDTSSTNVAYTNVNWAMQSSLCLLSPTVPSQLLGACFNKLEATDLKGGEIASSPPHDCNAMRL